MESDESIDLEDSEAVNAYRSVVVKKEHENPCEHFCESDWYWRNSTLASRFPFYLSDKYQPWYKIIKNRLKA